MAPGPCRTPGEDGGARFWLRLLRLMLRHFLEDDGFFLAAAIAYYAFFSLFPLLLLSISVVGYLLSVPYIHEHVVNLLSSLTGKADPLGVTLEATREVIPMPIDWIEKEAQVLARHWGSNLAIGVVVGLWSGRHLFGAMEVSLHRAWEIPLERNIAQRNLLNMGLVALCGTVALFTALLAAFFSGIQGLLSRLPLQEVLGISPGEAQIWGGLVSWVLVPLAAGGVFLLLYTLLPSRRPPLAHVLPGAVFSTVAWKLSSLVYVEYAVYFGERSAIYGSIWYIVGLLMWLYVVAVVFLLGAELVYAHRSVQQRCEDSPSS